MARYHAALATDRITPIVPAPTSRQPADTLDVPPSTKRLPAFDLARALEAMNATDTDACIVSAAGEDPTVTVISGTHRTAPRTDETITLSDLGVERDDDFPFLTTPPSSEVPAPSGIRRRFGFASAPNEEVATRRLVISIWAVAIAMASIFGYVLLTEESSRAYKVATPPTAAP